MSEERATWTAAYINDLPDSCFLYIEPGGEKDDEGKTTPRSLRHFPYKDSGGNVDMPHLRNALSRIPQSNLPASVKERLTSKAQGILSNQSASLEFDGELVRFQPPSAEPLFELRSTDEGGMPTLVGHFAVWDSWTEINSSFEGNFMERIAPGAFSKTFAENASRMRVLFNHGKDISTGEKVLGKIADLHEDERGAYYEVPLYDRPYVHDLLPGLADNQYGSSFRFRVVKEEFDRRPERTEHNPEALPERTIQEARVFEFGPVTFPAYGEATAGLRSATDWLFEQDLRHQLEVFAARAAALDAGVAKVTTGSSNFEQPPPASRRTRRDYLRAPEKEEKRWV